MKKIIILLLITIPAVCLGQTWVTWNGNLYFKTGTDSTYYGEESIFTTIPPIAGKQSSLSSGTNIKTIKGQPIIGSGDIAIVWGDLTGTLSTQTDLQNALNAKLAANGNGGSLTGLTASQVGLANVDNTSDANKPISTATQSALNEKQASLVSGSNIKTINGTTLLGSGDISISGSGPSRVFLPNDVINNNGVANTIQDVTGLSFPVVANTTYKFTFWIVYNSAATTTGSRWSINGPATTFINYKSTYTLNAGAESINSGVAGYNLPAAASASSISTNNIARIEGVIRPSADGTVIARFASEVLSSAITAVASGRSYVEYQVIN